MGCVCTGRGSNEIEETYLKPFEDSLKLKNKSVKDIDRAFYRFSYLKSLSHSQLDRACSSLQIPLSLHSSFFDFFIQNSKFSARKLSTLGILLGKGSISEKSSILFDNYDEDISNSLELDEIKEVIQDILDISCHYIPMYVSWLYQDEEKLKKNSQITKMTTSYLAKIYIEDLLGDDDIITKELFIKRFEKKLATLLDTEQNRNRCSLIYSREVKPHEKIFKQYENKVLNEHKVLHRFCTMADSNDAVRRKSKISLTMPLESTKKKLKTSSI